MTAAFSKVPVKSATAAADAGIRSLGRADIEAGIGRVLRRGLAVLDVLQEVHGLVTHLEGTLADLTGGQALLHQLDLDRQGVGNHQSERARGDLVLCFEATCS